MRRPMLWPALLAAATLAGTAPAPAVEPDEVLADPVLETRAREIGRELRCVVCQSQSIDDSDAPLAKDLRLLVRERLVAGDTNEEAVSYIVDRYGDYVLLKPPLRAGTLLLWGAPAAAFLLAAGFAVFLLRRRIPATTPTPLSDEEKQALAKLTE